jgi:hypothetical protein
VTICFFCEEYANNNVYSADGTLFFMSIEIWEWNKQTLL